MNSSVIWCPILYRTTPIFCKKKKQKQKQKKNKKKNRQLKTESYVLLTDGSSFAPYKSI